MKRNFDNYFNAEVASASFLRYLNGRWDEVTEYLYDKYSADFRSMLAFQTWMFEQEKLNQAGNDCFERAVHEFVDRLKAADTKKVQLKQLFFGVYKRLYLQQLYTLWADSRSNKQQQETDSDIDLHPGADVDCRIRSSAAAVINRLDKSCRELVVWRYFDGFTPEQMATITAKAPAVIQKELYGCFLALERLCRPAMALPGQEDITEEQYRLLDAYYAGTFTEEKEKGFADSIRADKLLQYYFQWFLSLHFEAVQPALLDAVLHAGGQDVITADEFISLVKSRLENHDQPSKK